eukprot:gene18719-20608_t
MAAPVIAEDIHVFADGESISLYKNETTPSKSSEDLSRLHANTSCSSSPKHQFHKPPQLSRSSSIGGETGSDSSVANSPLMDRILYKRTRVVSESKTPTESELDEDESEDLEDGVKIKIGVCAMNKKTCSRPMKEILARLRKSNLLHFEVFQDEMILNEDVENWPVVDCLISFYSTGFPLDKALKYVELRQPFLLNDLKMQYILMDRRKVYEMLVKENIEVPRYSVFNRDADNNPVDSDTDLIEYDDNIEINGQIFTKPFVEKPVSAEDHNIYIYYPMSAGGGCQILFRKIGSRSSVYSSESRVRRIGSYLYEEFMATAGTDVKVYTVGEEYAHAEARKSPALDGKVERDAQGKEIRYPVILSAREKLIAKQVCSIFKQTVCGFDLLRTNGKSYVCDVNGFSFVKTSQKYYDDCSQILADVIFQNLAPQFWIPNPLLYQVPQFEEEPVMTTGGTMLELRCIVGIIRHGDRTPKQKMKMIVHNKLWFDLFDKYGGPDEGKLKFKTPKQLQEVLDITRELLRHVNKDDNDNIRENPAKLLQMKSVLEMYGHFSGINRKLQLKSLNDKRNMDMKKKFKGRNKNAEPPHSDSGNPTLLLILKWGGELTPMGKRQAEELGRAFRCMYPGGQGEYGVIPGCGFLRLHSTYRHDLKIYASDEGRVQMTAAAFAKGLLQLEGELPPILASLVKSDKNVTGMLDATADVSLRMLRVKSEIHDVMHIEREFTEEDIEKIAPTQASSLIEAIKTVSNPHLMCEKVHEGIRSLTAQISALSEKPDVDPNAPILYHEESIRLMENRWQKLEKDFKMGDGKYDISLIPDIYDCVKYDYLHNRSLHLEEIPELYRLSKSLADIVIPQEYGVTVEEKFDISKQVCSRLMKKIHADLMHMVENEDEIVHRLDPRYSKDVVTPHRHVRTRLYFTSESHVHCMLAALRYGGLFDEMHDEQWKRASEHINEISELSYLTQIVLMQYEDPMADIHSDQRFHVELYFSPGCKTPDQIIRMARSKKEKSDSMKKLAKFKPRTRDDCDTNIDTKKRSRKHSRSRRSSMSDTDQKNIQPSSELRMPITVLQYNKALAQGLRSSPPNLRQHGLGSAPSYIPRYPLRSVPGRNEASKSKDTIRALSAPNVPTSTSTVANALRSRQGSDPMVSLNIAGIDVVETLPSLHPLISLHSSITIKKMEEYMRSITSAADNDADLSQSRDQSFYHQDSVLT